MNKKHWLIIMVLLICCAMPTWAATSQQYPGRIFNQSQVGTVDPSWIPESLVVSPDGQQFAYVAKAGDKQYVVFTDVVGKKYDEILNQQLVFSPKSNHLAYIAKNAGKYLVVVDGAESKAYEAILDASFQFSSDGNQFIYIAKNNNKWMVVANGKEGKAYDAINAATLAINSDANRLVYAAYDGSKWLPIIDGVEGKPYDTIRSLILSPDGQRVAFIARIGESFVVIADNEPGPSYPMIKSASLVFSPDGKRLAYIVEDGASQFGVIDGVVGKSYEYIGSSGITFSPDSKRFAYPVLMNGQWFMVVDGNEGKLYEGLMQSKPVFSHNSQRLAFFAKRADDWFLVIDGAERKAYSSIGINSFVFAPNSRDYAYVAKVPCGWTVVNSGDENRCYQAVGLQSLTYSPDGSHFAYNAFRGDKWVVVLDGHEGRQFDNILLGTRKIPFSNPVSFSYLALETNKVLIVNERTSGQLGREIKFELNPPNPTHFIMTTKSNLTIGTPEKSDSIVWATSEKVEYKISKTAYGFYMTVNYLEIVVLKDGEVFESKLAKIYSNLSLSFEVNSQGQLLNVIGLDKLEKRYRAAFTAEEQKKIPDFNSIISGNKLLENIKNSWNMDQEAGKSFRIGEIIKSDDMIKLATLESFRVQKNSKLADEVDFRGIKCVRWQTIYSADTEKIKRVLFPEALLSELGIGYENLSVRFSGESESIVNPSTLLAYSAKETAIISVDFLIPGRPPVPTISRHSVEVTFEYK